MITLQLNADERVIRMAAVVIRNQSIAGSALRRLADELEVQVRPVREVGWYLVTYDDGNTRAYHWDGLAWRFGVGGAAASPAAADAFVKIERMAVVP